MGPHSLKVDIRGIAEDLGAAVVLDGDLELPAIELGPERFEPAAPARLHLTVTNTGAGIVASGRVDAVFRAVCVRCLRDFDLVVSADVDGFYVRQGDDAEIPEEQEFGYIEGDSIELMDQILAALILELPFAPLHAEDCPGICPQCGADRNEGVCGCPESTEGSPFSVLRDLLEGPDAP